MTTSLLDATAVIRACVFTLAGEPLAFDVRSVREVAVFEDWTAVPLAPGHMVGAANLRGDVMPLVDARPLLGLPVRRLEQRVRTLVVVAEGLEAALVIDGVTSLEAFAEIVEATGSRHASWALGLLRSEDRVVPLLDAARLLRGLRPGGSGPTA
jgi:purine-binding chemotaxis protein CheW